MKRSTDRIITSHAGTLQRPERMSRGGPINDDEFFKNLGADVEAVVKRQADMGIDILNDGEYGKRGGFSQYVQGRLGGLEERETDTPLPSRSVVARDAKEFPGFYAGNPSGFGGMAAGMAAATGQRRAPRINAPVFCVAPLTYTGQDQVQTDIRNLKAALEKTKADVEGYLPANTVGTIEHWLWNDYYKSDEEFLFALADAMHEEYKAIVDAGFVLQLDDPDLPDGWQMYPEMSVEDYRKYAEMRVEATNHALRGLPEDRVRLHICWGSFHGPHRNDIALRDIVDIVLKVKAECYSIEAANPRHEHEWEMWKDVKLPAGKTLMPGVVSHVSDLIEHPELVAQRLTRYADVVGRENVIAGTDCGLGYRVGHEEIMWAKLETMVEGARLASKRLWSK